MKCIEGKMIILLNMPEWKKKRDDDEDGVDVIYHLLNISCAKYSNRHRRHRVKDCCPIIIIIIFG